MQRGGKMPFGSAQDKPPLQEKRQQLRGALTCIWAQPKMGAQHA
jgi:hypothetical protein